MIQTTAKACYYLRGCMGTQTTGFLQGIAVGQAEQHTSGEEVSGTGCVDCVYRYAGYAKLGALAIQQDPFGTTRHAYHRSHFAQLSCCSFSGSFAGVGSGFVFVAENHFHTG